MTLERKRLPHRLIVPIAILLIAAFTIAAGAATAEKPKQYTGEKISLNLKDADLRDVLNTFGKLSGITMNIDADVQGKVTVDFRDVPWDEAFDIIVRQNNLEWQATGDTIHVFR